MVVEIVDMEGRSMSEPRPNKPRTHHPTSYHRVSYHRVSHHRVSYHRVPHAKSAVGGEDNEITSETASLAERMKMGGRCDSHRTA